MKLSYLAHSKIPSKEANSVHVMKMCYALSRAGVQVDLFVPENSDVDEDPYAFYGVEPVFIINRNKWKRVRFGNFLYSYRVLMSLLKDRNRVVFGRDLVSCYMASLYGFKTIWESHTPVEYMGKLYTYLFRKMISQKNYLKTVVISSTLKAHYEKSFSIPSSRVVVIPDCSDEVNFESVQSIELINDTYKANVGYIGQLYPGKGMEIVSQLVPLCQDVMFHVIGGFEKDVSFWKEQLMGYQNVKFHGFVKPASTASYGLAMDILVAPYLNKVQGVGSKDYKKDLSMWMSPLKLFEYMSFKKPIVSSDLPVLHDVLNEQNSIMCNPNDINSWVDAIYSLINNPKKAERISNNAYRDFINNYTWGHRAHTIIGLYQ